jgi:hypothetical protein
VFECRDADPDRWGVAVCTTDGQLFTHGDTDDYFSIQSSSKPITYALAIKERSEEFVHKWVGELLPPPFFPLDFHLPAFVRWMQPTRPITIRP